MEEEIKMELILFTLIIGLIILLIEVAEYKKIKNYRLGKFKKSKKNSSGHVYDWDEDHKERYMWNSEKQEFDQK